MLALTVGNPIHSDLPVKKYFRLPLVPSRFLREGDSYLAPRLRMSGRPLQTHIPLYVPVPFVASVTVSELPLITLPGRTFENLLLFGRSAENVKRYRVRQGILPERSSSENAYYSLQCAGFLQTRASVPCG